MRKIRQAQKTDLSRIHEIISAGLRQCVLNSEEHFGPLYSEICQDLEWSFENQCHSLLWVIEQNDFIVGVALVKEFWILTIMFVDPKYHRLGIARELLTRVIDHCRDRSPKGCLRLNSSNYAAPFYKKMSFILTDEPQDLPGGCVPFEYKYTKDD